MGLFSSLFGGSDYGAGADKSAAMGAADNIGGAANALTGFGQQNLNYWNQDDARARGAVDAYGNYLRQDPFTDTRDAADLSRATGGSVQAYARANANLQAQLEARGLDTASSGAPSSIMAGGLTNLASQQANTLANAQNQLAYSRIAQRRQNLADETNLYGGQAGRDAQLGESGVQSGGSLYGNEGSIWSGLYSGDVARQQAQSQGLMGLLGGAGQLAGDYYGMGAAQKVLSGGGYGAGKGAAPAAGGYSNAPATDWGQTW